MSEKMERRLKIALNCFFVIAVIVVALCLWSNSQYSQNDHSVEQGHLPVYVTPPTDVVNTDASGEVIEEDFFANFDAALYDYFTYENVLDACSKGNQKCIKVNVTVYSVLKTSSSVVYSVADEAGNYYSIIDQSNGQLPELEKSDFVVIYGKAFGLAKMNNSEVPQLEAAFFEEA